MREAEVGREGEGRERERERITGYYVEQENGGERQEPPHEVEREGRDGCVARGAECAEHHRRQNELENEGDQCRQFAKMNIYTFFLKIYTS